MSLLTLENVTLVLSALLFITGSLLILAAAIGVARFRDTMSRVHAITKPQTIGLVLCILGAAVRIGGSNDFIPAHRSDLGLLLLLVIFALLTSPVTGQRVSRIARREGLYGRDEDMTRNDKPAANTMRRD